MSFPKGYIIGTYTIILTNTIKASRTIVEHLLPRIMINTGIEV